MIYLALRKRPKTNKLIDWIPHLAIKFRIVSEYSHGGIYDGIYMYDITAKDNMSKYVLESKDGWDFFPADISKDDLEIRYLEYMQHKYDWFSLLSFFGLKARDSDRLYCFEWCYIALTGRNPSVKITPEKLLAICAEG